MGTKPQVVKGVIGAAVGVAALAGIAGAMGNGQQQHAAPAPVAQPVTYSDCRTEHSMKAIRANTAIQKQSNSKVLSEAKRFANQANRDMRIR